MKKMMGSEDGLVMYDSILSEEKEQPCSSRQGSIFTKGLIFDFRPALLL